MRFTGYLVRILPVRAEWYNYCWEGSQRAVIVLHGGTSVRRSHDQWSVETIWTHSALLRAAKNDNWITSSEILDTRSRTGTRTCPPPAGLRWGGGRSASSGRTAGCTWCSARAAPSRARGSCQIWNVNIFIQFPLCQTVSYMHTSDRTSCWNSGWSFMLTMNIQSPATDHTSCPQYNQCEPHLDCWRQLWAWRSWRL